LRDCAVRRRIMENLLGSVDLVFLALSLKIYRKEKKEKCKRKKEKERKEGIEIYSCRLH
jgi:hypothetical protein